MGGLLRHLPATQYGESPEQTLKHDPQLRPVSRTPSLLRRDSLKKVGQDVNAEEEAAPVGFGFDELLGCRALLRCRIRIRPGVSAYEWILIVTRDGDSQDARGEKAQESHSAEVDRS